jgi:hypothetical protein
MADIGIRWTCPVCRLSISLAHAIRVVTQPHGNLLVIADDRAPRMHTCVREAR